MPATDRNSRTSTEKLHQTIKDLKIAIFGSVYLEIKRNILFRPSEQLCKSSSERTSRAQFCDDPRQAGTRPEAAQVTIIPQKQGIAMIGVNGATCPMSRSENWQYKRSGSLNHRSQGEILHRPSPGQRGGAR